MTQKIEVVYKPIVTVSGKTIYHKYLIYTDGDGKQHYARGGPAVGDGHSNRGGDASSQSVSKPNGNIVTEHGEYNSDTADWIDPQQDNRHRETIIESDEDLSEKWKDITDAIDDIEEEGHTYGPGRNSNTTVDTALGRAGLPAPEDDNYGEKWSPGSGYPLPEEPQPDPGPAKGVADYASSWILQFALAWVNSSLLILDLDYSGTIELISLANSETYWDGNVDGFSNISGWVTGGDGFLAYDINNNGRIDNNSELFGTVDTDGFTILSQYDSNADNQITPEDTIWSDLIIWIDANENGNSEVVNPHFRVHVESESFRHRAV